MLALIYSSQSTEYTVDTCDSVEEAERVCKDRFSMRNPKFGQTDEGRFYTLTHDGVGIVVLSLHEVDEP